MESKICNVCDMEKPISEFHKDKTKKGGYRNKCKTCQSTYIKKYYKDNKEILTKKNKEWRKNNHHSIIERNKDWKKNNPDKYKKIQRKYVMKNKDKILEYRREYEKKRKSEDPVFKLRCYLARTISDVIRENNFKKKSKTCEILGCSFKGFKKYLESQFEDWMNWDNYGNPKDGILEPNKSWDIDHIIPISLAETEDDIIRLNHYSNLRPLCSYYNRNIKRNDIN